MVPKKVPVSVSEIFGTGKKYRYRYRLKFWVPSHTDVPSGLTPFPCPRILDFFIVKTKHNHSFISTGAHLAVSYRKKLNFENFVNAMDQYKLKLENVFWPFCSFP